MTTETRTETTTRTETLRRLVDEVEAEWAGRIGAHNLVVRVPVPELRVLLDVVDAARAAFNVAPHTGWETGPGTGECDGECCAPCTLADSLDALAALDTPGGQE